MGKPGQQHPQGGSALDNTIGAWAQNNDTSNQPAPMGDVQMNPQRFKKNFILKILVMIRQKVNQSVLLVESLVI